MKDLLTDKVQAPRLLKKILSYFSEQVVETIESPLNGKLEVWYIYGRYELNAASVNYSYGALHKVMKSALSQLNVETRKINSVLVLGLGAGSVVSILREKSVTGTITGVEWDPIVIQLGKKYFGLDKDGQLEIICEDAFDFVSRCKQKFDLVVVDLFRDAEIPQKAEEKEFLLKLADLLNDGGLLMFNRLMLNPGLEEKTEIFSRRMQEVLPGARYIHAGGNRMMVYDKTALKTK